MEFLFIFIAKIIEVSLMTLRLVFVNRGEKLYASIIGFIEVSIWLRVVSVVIIGISENPIKMLAYALGFACGSYIGLMLEEKIGLGYSTVQIITSYDEGERIALSLRNTGKAVTVIRGEGRDDKKAILLTHVKRKDKDIIVKFIEALDIQAVVTVSEAQKIYGGFGIGK